MSLLEESKVYKPFQYPSLMAAAVEHEKVHWIEEEITNIQEDLRDFKKIDAKSREVIEQTLKLFTQSDVSVGQWYIERLLPIIKNNEARCWLLSAAAREGIHQRAYALLNESLAFDDSIYTKFTEYDAMKKKFEFMSTSLAGKNKEEQLAYDLAQLVFMEGVMLFGAFATLINFQRAEAGGTMKGMCKVVEWSCRDESMHVEHNARLFRIVCEEHPIVNNMFKSHIYRMAEAVVQLEMNYLDTVYDGDDLPMLRLEDVKAFVRYLADRRLIQLGLKGIFKQKSHPLGWLDEMLTAGSHTNFFELPVSEYAVGSLEGQWPTEYV